MNLRFPISDDAVETLKHLTGPTGKGGPGAVRRSAPIRLLFFGSGERGERREKSVSESPLVSSRTSHHHKGKGRSLYSKRNLGIFISRSLRHRPLCHASGPADPARPLCVSLSGCVSSLCVGLTTKRGLVCVSTQPAHTPEDLSYRKT